MLGAALILASNAAQACPGCKQATEGRDGVSLSGSSVAFSLSIFFLIFMVVALLGGLGFMMYRSCRVLAAQQRALLEEEDALPTGAAGMSGPHPA